MFEDDHMEKSDLLLGSILKNGQEEVPAHIWEGVSEGLDKIAKRRARVLWLGRVAAVAAAAAIVVGIFFRHGSEGMILPEAQGDMIAVVENVTSDDNTPVEEVLLANVEKHNEIAPKSQMAQDSHVDQTPIRIEIEEQESIYEAHEDISEEQKTDNNIITNGPAIIQDDIDWEEEAKRNPIKASIVISGIAGTNSPQNTGRIGPLRSPGMFKSPTKTTVEQTNSQTIYGIPLSFGAGVKLNFTKRWSLGMGLNYTLLTSKFSGKYTKVEDGIASLPISATVRNSQHYIGIPINAYYNIVSRDFINFYAYAGGAVEKCVADTYEIMTTPVIHHEESVKGIQLSANAGIGVEFLLGRYVGIYVDPSLRYYFHCGQPKSIRTAQPLMLGFEMGLRFNL